jgi:hypothetical protein
MPSSPHFFSCSTVLVISNAKWVRWFLILLFILPVVSKAFPVLYELYHLFHLFIYISFFSNVLISLFLLHVTLMLLAYLTEVISRHVTRLFAACPHVPVCVNVLLLFTHAHSYYEFCLRNPALHQKVLFLNFLLSAD